MVAWVRRHDLRGVFEFVSYQDAPSPPMTPALFEECTAAVHVLCADGTTLRAGRAALFITTELGWRQSGRLLSLPPFLWCVEQAYHLLASHRGLFGRVLFRERKESADPAGAEKSATPEPRRPQ